MSPVWSQSYTLFGHGLAVSAVIASLTDSSRCFSCSVSAASRPGSPPFRLVGWRCWLRSLPTSCPSRLLSAPPAYGAGFGLFPISWIVFWAITLYRVTVETGKFEIIKSSMGNLTSDARLQALLIAFAFGAFVEGAAGFGTPSRLPQPCWLGSAFLLSMLPRFAWWPTPPRSPSGRSGSR